jgi:hypothetical protein
VIALILAPVKFDTRISNGETFTEISSIASSEIGCASPPGRFL